MPAARELIKEVSFSITGQAVTDHVRLQVLSDQWREALDLLTQEVQGCTMEMALDILGGKKVFQGSSNSEFGIQLVDDSAENPETARYLETFAFQNCGLLLKKGKVYRPAYVIEALGQDDFDYAIRSIGRNENGTPAFMRLRAMYYVNTLKQELLVTVPDATHQAVRVDLRNATDASQMLVVWEERSATPSWAKTSKDHREALNEFLQSRSPMALGSDTTLLDLKKDPKAYEKYLIDGINLSDDEEDAREVLLNDRYQTQLLALREEILKRAGPKGGDGWIRVPISDEPVIDATDVVKYYLDVPKAPFIYWSIPHDPSLMGLCEKWTPASPSGMKMLNDDRHHTDWVIGAGFDPETFYKQKDVSDSCYWYRNQLCADLLKFEFTTLSRSTKVRVEGVVKHLKPGEILKEGEVGVIARASVEFDAALRSAAKHGTALICLTGGPLAHIATVGRELDVPILLWDKAQHLRDGYRVYINTEKGTIRVSEAK